MKHLLVVRFSAFGDVAMTVPVIRAVLEQNPDVRITYISSAALKDLFDGIERLDFVPAHLHGEHSGPSGLWCLWRSVMKKGRPDVFLDLHSVLRTYILRIYSNMYFIPTFSMNKHRLDRAELIKGNAEKRPLRTIPESYADVFRSAGYPVSLSGILKKQQRPLLEKTATTIGFKKMPFSVGIAPFSQYRGKTYPLEKMKEVVSCLSKREDTQVFLFGGRGSEAEELKKWAEDKENVHSVAGLLPLKDELNVMANLDLMVSMDSANMHLCSIVGTRVISVWGATHHFAGFLGFGQMVEDVVEKNMTCRPCSIFGSKPCKYGTYECIESISSDDILRKTLSVLGIR
ncbi:MAG: glycosyltransferase family 9 protein [Flavobacteriales bacterium]|nr:glycosyltransferase family 9 protein [Flavobacteriales bacterium]